MAAPKTPAVYGDTNYLDPGMATVTADGSDIAVVANTYPGRSTYYFPDIDDLDTYTLSAWRGPTPSCWFQQSSDADAVSVVLALTGESLVFTFQTDTTNGVGYLIVQPQVPR